MQQVLAAAGIYEQYGAMPPIIVEREAMRSSVLVRVPVARNGSSRAPILVTVARTAQPTIF